MGSPHPFTVVIPARYASSRLPGKPLRMLLDKPMVQHVHERALESGAARVLVATDHAEIEAVVKRFGGECVFTASEHASGTDRIAEVVRSLGIADDTIVVNLQGDEPCIPPQLVQQVAQRLAESARAGVATLAAPIDNATTLFDPNVVKVVLDADGGALYFSRAPIPWARDAFASGAPKELPSGVPYLRHIGMYAYRAGVLSRIASSPQAPSEGAESLEQLRALHHGIRIEVDVVQQAPSHGVDTEADVSRAEAELRALLT